MEKKKVKLTLSIDFDDTIVHSAFPDILGIKDGAKHYINKLHEDGHNILINTCRTGVYEGDAQKFLDDNGVKYHYINCNIPEKIIYYKQDCRKLSADVYVDDKCLMGLPPTCK